MSGVIFWSGYFLLGCIMTILVFGYDFDKQCWTPSIIRGEIKDTSWWVITWLVTGAWTLLVLVIILLQMFRFYDFVKYRNMGG